MLTALSRSLRPTLALLGAALLAAPALAQPADAPVRNYTQSDTTADALSHYKTAIEAKNYDSAMAILEAQLAKVAPDSYDAALIYQIETQTQGQKGDFHAALVPLEKGLALSDSKTPTYYDEHTTREFLFLQAQLYLQEAVQAEGKKDAALASSMFEKADNAMARWVKLNPKSTPDAQLIYAQLLYNRGVQSADHPDPVILQRALDQIDIGLKLSTHPKDTFYTLKMVCLHLLNRTAEATEVLEQMVVMKPDNATYWQQLAGLYMGANNELRTAISIERAQAHGLMNGPKDNFNLVGIYFNMGQYEKAADLLEAGLKSGGIENEIKNWELLALCYQQMQRPLKGIEALKEASKSFPKSGQIEFMIGQAYYTLEKPEQALPALQSAVAKGGLTKPHQVYSYLAYIAFELKKFDIALDAAQKAADTPEGSKDAATKNLLKSIQDIMKEREAKKAKM